MKQRILKKRIIVDQNVTGKKISPPSSPSWMCAGDLAVSSLLGAVGMGVLH